MLIDTIQRNWKFFGPFNDHYFEMGGIQPQIVFVISTENQSARQDLSSISNSSQRQLGVHFNLIQLLLDNRTARLRQ